MKNVILCGGSGTRLWPISRENLPKQFLKMFDNKSLFQLTYEKNYKISDEFLIITNENQYFIAEDQLDEIENKKNTEFIIESIGKNTAPAIAFAAFASDKEEILFITPSDHLIKADDKYYNAIKEAEKFAKEGFLVTFGINPKYPETGYGYIKYKGNEVLEFCEKPDITKAKEYLKSGNYLWNSGMFMFKAGAYLEELKKYAPEIYENSKKAFENAKKGHFIKIKYEDMLKIPEDSIDYAVMEKSKKIKVVKSDFAWNDVGNFDALDEVFEKDENGNTKNKNLVYVNSKNNFVFGKYKTIALNEINDLIIVDTPTALLVSKKGASQNIKNLVKILKEKNPEVVKFGRTVYRPWGSYTILFKGEQFQVKLLNVKPGGIMSLQKHLHRSEHWIVVEGTATITIEDKKFILRKNQSTYVEIGNIHRIENEGKIPLKIIEVQVGEYLGEDDIIRIEDRYGRS